MGKLTILYYKDSVSCDALHHFKPKANRIWNFLVPICKT